MGYFRLAFIDRFVWTRHRSSLWLFNHVGSRAVLVMTALFLVVPWSVNLAWMCGLIAWAFDGLHVSLPRFIAMMVGCAIPIELLFGWYRRLSAMLDPQEGRQLGELACSKSALLSSTVDRDFPGPWRPLIRIEAWMVRWAFDDTFVREASASGLRCTAPCALGKKQVHRL